MDEKFFLSIEKESYTMCLSIGPHLCFDLCLSSHGVSRGNTEVSKCRSTRNDPRVGNKESKT